MQTSPTEVTKVFAESDPVQINIFYPTFFDERPEPVCLFHEFRDFMLMGLDKNVIDSVVDSSIDDLFQNRALNTLNIHFKDLDAMV